MIHQVANANFDQVLYANHRIHPLLDQLKSRFLVYFTINNAKM